MQKIITKGADETKNFAEDLAKDFLKGGTIALSGGLGAGKTTFAQGFAKGLGIKDKIISPTFLIIRHYPIPYQKNFFYHIDLYRLVNIDITNLGLKEILEDPTNIVLIEWAEKINNYLPNHTKKIRLKKIKDGVHEIGLTTFSIPYPSRPN